MQSITSKNNKIIKDASSLTEKKYRDEFGLFLIEGPNFVRDAIRFGGRVRFIFTKVGASSSEIAQIEQLAEEHGSAVYRVSEDVFSKLSATQTSQGVIAVAEKKLFGEEDVFKAGGNVLVLDRIQDPGNMGTMLRTAEAMGMCGVVLIKGCVDIYSPKVVRAAAGSLLRLPTINADSADHALELLKKYKKSPFAADMDGRVDCYHASLAKDAAIIIGNEGNGVSSELLSQCTTVNIPMEGSIESLNAALAAAMLMYESLRQRNTEK